jgi:formylmethanofuran dehydrogenase subunit E
MKVSVSFNEGKTIFENLKCNICHEKIWKNMEKDEKIYI